MKQLLTLFFVLLQTPAWLAAQNQIDVYISSSDCIKCTSALSQILHFYEKNPISRVQVFTDFNSNKIRLLRDFPELKDSDITCDRDLIRRKAPDGRSLLEYRDGAGAPMAMLLTELDLPALRAKQTIPAENRWEIPDSLLERGNYTPCIQGDRVVLEQYQLQEVLYAQLLPDRAITQRWSLQTSRLEYEAIRGLLKNKKQINALSYDSAFLLNQQNRLPMQSTEAIQVDQDTLRMFRSFYFYLPTTGGGLGNRGFVFAQQLRIDEQLRLLPQNATLIELAVLPDSVLVAPFIHAPHQSLGQGRYFAFYNLYNDPENRFKLSDRYLGCIYTPGPNGLMVHENLRLGAVAAPDSVQIAFRRSAYGNGPLYFSCQGKHYILLKFSTQVLDVSQGRIESFSDFIKNIYPDKPIQAPQILYGLRSQEQQLEWVCKYPDQVGLFYHRIGPDGQWISKRLDYTGQVDALSIQERRILVLVKNEARNLVEIQVFPLPK
jgi:hypothetical protein